MNNEKNSKKLNTLESFFQFNTNNITDKQKDLYSIVAFISSIIWLTLSFTGILLGLIWIIILSSIFFKIVSIGIKSNKKWMSIVSIVLYSINIIYWILVMILNITGNL